MSSSFQGLFIGLSAVQAQQRAMEIAGQNVANVNTPGYSRQRVTLTPLGDQLTSTLEGFPPTPQAGSGVDLVSIQRIGMGVLARQLRSETATLREWEARQDGLTRLEGLLQDLTDQGLSHTLDAFWSAWRDLAANPQEMAARLKAISHGQQLAQSFNLTSDRLVALQSSLDDQVAGLVDQVNEKATRVAELNRQIRVALATDQQPNELLDQRDLLVTEIVEAAGASVVENEDGTVTAKIGDQALVDGVDAYTLTNARIASGGKLRGLIHVRDVVIPEQLNALDTLAVALKEGVNAAHTAGYGADGSTGFNFFEGMSATDLTVNPAIADDPYLVAAASTADAPADGSNALELAGVADVRTLPGLGGNTIGGFYHQQVSALGLLTQEADEQVAGQEAVVTFLDNQRAAISGVSLDEEAVNLIQFQRAYQAAARVITSVDEMLGRMINGMGIVGR